MDEVFRTQINGFHGYLQTQHYATRTSKDYEEYVIKFLQWCKDVPNQGGDLEKTMLSYLDQQYHSKSSIAQFKMLRAAVRNYYFYLTGEKLPFSPKQSAPEWIKKEIDGYFAFLRDIADIKETTIIPHCKYVRRFLLYASNQGVCKSSGITVLLPGLLEKLSRIPDPRNPNKIKHKMTVILLYGILMFVYQAPSRRKANQKMTTPLLLENLKAVFPELEDMPHQSTLCRLLEKMDVDSIETAYHELLKQNIRKKRFKNMLHKKRYLVAVDGTQKYVMDECWDERFLRRKIRGKDDEYHYYAYVLEAVLIFANGMVLPLMSEFLENTPELEAIENDEAWKQDCELKAFYRLTKRLKTTFPKLPVTLLLDGLYANGPVMEVCRRNKWHFMIVLKDGSLPSVWQEVNGLLRLDSQGECRHTQKWQDRKQIFNWVNEIEYSYSVGARKKKMLIHVVTCDESWEVTDKTGTAVIRTSRHA